MLTSTVTSASSADAPCNRGKELERKGADGGGRAQKYVESDEVIHVDVWGKLLGEFVFPAPNLAGLYFSQTNDMFALMSWPDA